MKRIEEIKQEILELIAEAALQKVMINSITVNFVETMGGGAYITGYDIQESRKL